MSYVYMRALETAPERYDRGIRWLSWNRLTRIRDEITEAVADSAGNVLDIGVGTATQAILMARRGVHVVGIDHSPGMLSIARRKLELLTEEDTAGPEVARRIELQNKAAVQLDEFPPHSFDAVTATLVFSELSESERRYVLAHAFRILRPGGLLVIADEVRPKSRAKKLAHALLSAPLKSITYILTQTTTSPASDLEERVQQAGFEIERTSHYQLDSFEVIYARRPDTGSDEPVSPLFEPIEPPQYGILMRMWTTAARMIGHPTEIGLIPINNPSSDSPVLCTCNFKLTVSRLYNLVREEESSAWLRVAPTDGINVWCAACGGDFNAGSVITAIKVSSLEEYVSHRTIVLPQLGAPGIDPVKVRER